MRVGSGFEEVADEGFVGPEADAGVLEVDDDGVDLAEVGWSGVLVGGFGAVEGDDGEVGGGVGFCGEVFGVLLAVEAVLWGEEGGELDGGVGVEEDVDGAGAVAVEAGLVGKEGDAERFAGGVGEGFEGGEVGLFEDVDAGEGLGVVGGGRSRFARDTQVSEGLRSETWGTCRGGARF